MSAPERPLRALSLNCHRNPEVVFSVLNSTSPNSDDILCLQELPDDIETRRAFQSAAWIPVFPPTHLTRSPTTRIRSCIFISSLIPSDSYRVSPVDSLDIASISLIRLTTPLTIYSVYNPPDSDCSIDALAHLLSHTPPTHDHPLITGDFNKHHPLWAGPLAPPQRSQRSNCNTLLQLATNYALQQCLPPGTPPLLMTPGQPSTLHSSLATLRTTSYRAHLLIATAPTTYRYKQSSTSHLPATPLLPAQISVPQTGTNMHHYSHRTSHAARFPHM